MTLMQFIIGAVHNDSKQKLVSIRLSSKNGTSLTKARRASDHLIVIRRQRRELIIVQNYYNLQ